MLKRLTSERGSIIVLTALSLTMLLGVTALAIDASYMFDMRHRIAAAADAAALSAAMEYKRVGAGSLDNVLTEYAKKEVEFHSFTAVACGASGGAAVCLTHPPSSGAYSGDSNYVEISVSQSVPTFFMRVMGRTSMTVSARSVAGIGQSKNCLISLKAKDKETLRIEDDSDVVLSGCDAVVNSKKDDGLKIGKKGSLTVRRISLSGTQWKNKKGKDGLDCTDTAVPCPQVGMPPIEDPLVGLAEPAASEYASPGDVQTAKKNKTLTISNGAYKGIEVEENATLQMGSGNYYLTKDGFKADKGATVTGTNVMIYVKGGKVEIKENAGVTLSAPTAPPYAGILFFQSRTNTEKAHFNEGSDFDVSGLLYFPKADIEFGNKKSKKAGTLTTDCTLFIGQKIKFKKKADMLNTCSGYGSSPLHTITLAE